MNSDRKELNNIILRPIGIIYSPFDTPEGMPIQPTGAEGIEGKIEIFPEFEEGLKDLDGFSHIILIFNFHKSKGFDLLQKPFLDRHNRGVFAIRSPKRPNPLGLSVVRLVSVEGNIIRIVNVDILNGTPLLDIKPYIPAVDSHSEANSGWVGERDGEFRSKSADSRFKS